MPKNVMAAADTVKLETKAFCEAAKIFKTHIAGASENFFMNFARFHFLKLGRVNISVY